MQTVFTRSTLCFFLLFSSVFAGTTAYSQAESMSLTEALGKVGEYYEVFFAYDADLLRDLHVRKDLSQYESLEDAVSGLLSESGLLYDLVGPKYCVIYRDDARSRRTKRKIERKIRQIQTLEESSAVSVQRRSATGSVDMPLRAISRGYGQIKREDKAGRKRVAPAVIKGTVTDANTGETLIGANVFLKGTSFGAATDLDGEFTIANIPPGTYTVVYSYIGYKTEERPEIVLASGTQLTLDAAIGPESILGEEIIITAQAQGQIAAINQQRASSGIVNIVSSEFIQEVPDVNAAESIGRLPGVSLKRSGGEGNKIVVRGLSPQYTNVTIDGVRMTGVDGDRSVGLSIISSEMLDGIELSKSLTPDKDADAIGGVVNLRLREAGKGFQVRTLALGGYNDLERSFANYKFAANISNRFLDDKLGVLVNLGQEQVIRSSDIFSAGYRANNTGTTQELYTESATVTERKAIRQRTHGSVMLDYKIGPLDFRLNNFYSRMRNQNEGRRNSFNFAGTDPFRFGIFEDEPIESIRTHSLRTTADIGTTELDVNLSISDTQLDVDGDSYNFVDRSVLDGGSISEGRKLFAQPAGIIDEFFDISSGQKSLLQNNVRSASVRRDQTNTVDINWKVPYSLFDGVSGYLKTGVKYANKQRSNDTEATETYYNGGIGVRRVTNLVLPTFPDFLRNSDVGIPSSDGVVGANFLDPDYDYGEVLNGRYELGYSMDLNELKRVHDILYEKYGNEIHWSLGVPSNQNDYQNTEILTAGYIMTEINIGENIMILPGVRFENVETTYTGSFLREDPFDPDGLRSSEPVTAERQNDFFFPSVNMKIDLNEWSDVRAAAYRSASRPDYQFLSPALAVNVDGSRIRSFNPYLRPSLANNFDLGISFFTNKLGLFTINGFHKEIDGLIYRLPQYQPREFSEVQEAPASLLASLEAPRALYDPAIFDVRGAQNGGIPINNPNTAFFTGFEISWQTNFWYLPGLLSGLVLDLNYSRIWSRTEFPFLERSTVLDDTGPIPLPREIFTYQTREASLLDQPADLFNARIGWDFKGFSSRLSFRYQGQTFTSLDPTDGLFDAAAADQFRIDLTIKQQITDRLSFALDVANLNEFIDDSNFVTQGFVMPQSSEFYGLTAQFGFRYNFDLDSIRKKRAEAN
jgi:TonB-dependent receptor